MADVKISQLPESTTIASNDYVPFDQTASSTTKKISVANLFAASLPAGGIIAYGGGAAPSGFLICDGSAVSRTTYSTLYGIIGTTFGAGDGTSTFNLPNLQGRVPVGKDSSNFPGLGNTGGEVAHQLSVNELASHTHGTHIQGNIAAGGSAIGGQSSGLVADSTTATGGNAPHNNLQPYLVINFIIKT